MESTLIEYAGGVNEASPPSFSVEMAPPEGDSLMFLRTACAHFVLISSTLRWCSSASLRYVSRPPPLPPWPPLPDLPPLPISPPSPPITLT